MGCIGSTTRFTGEMPKLPQSKPSTFIADSNNVFKQQYRIGKEIGTGAFGEVRGCVHIETKTQRAVKFMNKSQMDEKEISECRNEFQILAKLNHPNIIQCFGFYDEKN
jgi:serine/threonine protein kinase